MRRSGVILAVSAFLLWGFLPLYWKQLSSVGALEILSHRIFWCFVFLLFYLWAQGKLKVVKSLFTHRKKTLMVVVRSLILGCNWFIFVWAVNTGKVVESSFGYYINPLFTVILGVLVLKERLESGKIISFLLACVGVGIMTVGYGRLPWVSLALAGSFGMYGLFKKLSPSDSIQELFAEMMFLAPLAAAFIGVRAFQGEGIGIGVAPLESVLLAGAGVVTALPLVLFGYAAKLVPLSTIGFTQYLAPTGMLLLGVLLFREQFSWTHFTGFLCIWVALGLFTVSSLRRQRLTGR